MNKKILFGLIGAIFATGAWATNDGRILTTQTYVDNALGSKVDIAQGAGDNNENVGKTLVVNQQGNLELGAPAAANYIEDSITDGVTNKAPSENAVHDALENKQDTIATDMVDFNDGVADLPAITTYDTTGGLVANKIGILDQETIFDDEGDLRFYNTNEYGTQMDNYVPTVRAVADGLTYIRTIMPNSLAWTSSLQTPINNYSTTFSSASDTWPNNQQNYVPTAQTFANGLALKQNKIPASEWQNVSNNTIPGVIVSTDEDGVVEQRMILDKTGNITGQSIDEMVHYGEASQGILDDIRHDSVTADDVNNAVPTTTMTVAIANAAANVNNPKLAWSSSLQTPINNYSTTFGITSDTWPRNRENYVPTVETFANGLALKQNKIAAENGSLILGQQDMTGMKSVLAPTATPGVVNQIGLWDADGWASESWNINSAYEPSDRSVIRASIPTVGAVETGLNTKQNTIATDMVDFTEPEEQIDYELPSLVTYDSANGVNGTRIGLVDLDNGGAGITFLANDMNPRDSVNAVYDNYVPTFRTVAVGLGDIWNEMPERLYWFNSHLQTPINNYSTTFTSASDTWPNDQQDYVPTAETFANGLALKQNKIPAGTAGNVVTYTGTAGTVGSVEVLSSFDNYDSTTDSEKLVNAGAIVGALSESDISNHTINGAPLSNAASVFYGTSSTAAATETKEVSIPSITTLSIGTMIIVQPENTSTVASSSIKLNNFDAYPMRYNDAAITTSTDSIVWSAAYPSIFVFDGTYWRFVAHGIDNNATYSVLTVADGIAGTATAARTISAANAKQIIQGTTLTGIDTTATTPVVATDSITTGIGKLQGQVDTKQNKMTCTRWLDTPEHPEHNDDNCLLWDLGN